MERIKTFRCKPKIFKSSMANPYYRTTRLFRGTRLETKQDTDISICRSFLAQLANDQLTIMIPSVDYRFFHFIDIPRENISKSGHTQSQHASISVENGSSSHKDLRLKFRSESWTFLMNTEAMYSKEIYMSFSSTEEAYLIHNELQENQSQLNGPEKMPPLIVFESTVLDVSDFIEDLSVNGQDMDTHIVKRNGDPEKHVSSVHDLPRAANTIEPSVKISPIIMPDSSGVPGMRVNNHQHDSAPLRESNQVSSVAQTIEHVEESNLAIHDIPLQDDDPVTPQVMPVPRKENGSQSPKRLKAWSNESKAEEISKVTKKNSFRQSTSLNSTYSPNMRSEILDDSLIVQMRRIRNALSADTQKGGSIQAKSSDCYIEISPDAQNTPILAVGCRDNVVKPDRNKEVEHAKIIHTPQRMQPDDRSHAHTSSEILGQTKGTSPSNKIQDNHLHLSDRQVSLEQSQNEPRTSTCKRKSNIAHNRDSREACKRIRSVKRSVRQPLVNVNDDGSPIPIQAHGNKNLDYYDDFETDVIKAAKLYDEPSRAESSPNGSGTDFKISSLPLAEPPILTGEERMSSYFNPCRFHNEVILY